MSDSAVRVALLLPEVLGTYADSGNAMVLAQRLRWRGLDAEIVAVSASDVPPTSCDLYLLGGGEDTAQYYAARWLRGHPSLCAALGRSATTFAVCAGLQVLGESMVDRDGHVHAGVGLLDLTTRPGAQRAVGETVARCRLPGVGHLTGFSNHRGVTILGDGTSALADVERGPGNDADGVLEGAMTLAPAGGPGDAGRGPAVLGTYLHGPVLARNPALADHLLARVLGRALGPLDPRWLPELPAVRAGYLARARPLRSPFSSC